MKDIREFEINLLDHFTVKGQGIDVGYPLSNQRRNNAYYYLQVDEEVETYD